MNKLGHELSYAVNTQLNIHTYDDDNDEGESVQEKSFSKRSKSG